MDDKQFDDIIKKKLSEYEEPGFDPSALSALHSQLASTRAWPWYSRYRTELLMASGMALCTLIIVWSQWYFREIENDLLKKNTIVISDQHEQIKNLLSEITMLKNHTPDTVRVIERSENSPTDTYSIILLEQIANLQEDLGKMQKYLETYQSNAEATSSEILRGENVYGLSNEQESGYSYLHSKRLHPKQNRTKSAHAYDSSKIQPSAQNTERTLSTKTLRDLQKHYHKGIGIHVGPTVEISRGIYDGGIPKIDIAGGVLGDFILSPFISIETGAKFSHRVYEISEEDLASRPLPDVDSTLGPLTYADVDSWLLEVPLNLKYRFPLTRKTNLIGGLGYSARLYTRQLFEYSYGIDGNPDASITTSTEISKVQLYPGTLNISLGLDHQLKNNKILETSLFYQHGLGEAGVEKMRANFFGIRSTFWFTVK